MSRRGSAATDAGDRESTRALRDGCEDMDDDGLQAADAPSGDVDTVCGLGAWRPAWLQRLASQKAFTLLHGLVGLQMSALGFYMTGTLSTVEKRFHFSSQTTGVIAGAWEVGVLSSVLVLGYLGRRGHKPRLVGGGMFLMGLGCVGRLLPHLLFGAGDDALALTADAAGPRAALPLPLPLPPENASAAERSALCGAAPQAAECGGGGGGGSWGVAAVLMYVTNVMFGVSGSVYWSLGISYIDDNIRRDKAPLALAATSCIRLLGPSLGFWIASLALNRYIALDATPLIDRKDPRWIGAWWLGYGPLACSAVALGSLMLLFPRRLPRLRSRRPRPPPPPPPPTPPPARSNGLRDFLSSIKRMVQNRVLFFNTLSGVCYMFGIVGYWTYMPKYMETQYRQSASTANFLSGSVGILFSGVGIAASAVVIHKWKPRARTLAAWSVAVEAVDVLGHVSWAFLDCGAQDLHGSVGVGVAEGAWNLTATCNAQCGCGDGGGVKYEPVCSLAAATTFYSPCHAGCPSPPSVLNGTTTFSECACAPDGLVVAAACPRACAFNFAVFLASQCVMRFLGATGKAGNTLIQFRCVKEEDKPLAIAFSEFLLGVLTFLPGPVVYGILLDSACIVWGSVCGKPGNCWLYDDKKMRYLLNFTAGGCILIGTLLDVVVWYYCRDLNIYEEDEKNQESTLMKTDKEEISLTAKD